MISSNELEKYLDSIVRNLPNSPGVYQFFNNQDEIIYVGKARNLKKRVSSYFQKEHEIGKTRVMVSKICNIRYIVVETESDALLLENNLIKKYLPRYNILLKDGKTYPWICVKKEPFPRVFSTRNVVKDGSIYFGPYTSALMVRTLLELVRQLFQLRTCNYPLLEKNIQAGKFKVCLEYHIGNCKAPCIGNQLMDDYDQAIAQIRDILKGNIHSVINYLKELMKTYAAEYQYEQAEIVKRKIDLLERFQSKSSIVNPAINDVDVFSLVEEENMVAVNFLKVINGAIIQAHTLELVKRIEEHKEDMLSLAIVELRQRFDSLSREVLVPFAIEMEIPGATLTVPRIGDKKKLVELSERNAKYFLLEKKKQFSQQTPEAKTERLLEQIKQDLRLPALPVRMECFDNSNIQGTHPVAACVVFKNAKPAKSEYRHFNIKTVEGPDDFASMEEIIYRRYKRMLDESTELPQLIVIDGGKGQLGAALNSLEKLDLRGKVPIIGIAKKLEEIYFPGDSIPIYLDKQSQTLRVIQQMRDEAHRFGITFHRDKRSKDMAKSALDSIPGIGPKSLEALYSKFGSLSKIKQALPEEIIEVVGAKRYHLLMEYFKTEGNSSGSL
jgi:excinuclease ABC subunit C